MSQSDESIWDELFHGIAFSAFVQQAIEQGGPPDQELTRRRAFRLYEEALAEKNGRSPKRLHSECQSVTFTANCATVDS